MCHISASYTLKKFYDFSSELYVYKLTQTLLGPQYCNQPGSIRCGKGMKGWVNEYLDPFEPTVYIASQDHTDMVRVRERCDVTHLS